jgi:hypothetical protein
MGLSTLNIKAIGPSGKVVWSTVIDKYDNDGQPVALSPKVIDRGIKEAIGYSGKYRLVVK